MFQQYAIQKEWKHAGTRILLMSLCLLPACDADYLGKGWEDQVLKRRVYNGLKVTANDQTVTSDQLDDTFNWVQYFSYGKTARVEGVSGWSPEHLKSWVPRTDAVQHGYYMLYQLDNNVSGLEFPMEDYFFSITLDVGVCSMMLVWAFAESGGWVG